jgi:hypothetical protein
VTDVKVAMLAALVAKADRNYRFVPESYEMPFILSDEGLRWIRVFDPARRLYELTDLGRQQLDLPRRR